MGAGEWVNWCFRQNKFRIHLLSTKSMFSE